MIPYWRLSGFYFTYFATLGALIPYWSLYLKESGYNAGDIGALMAIILLTKIVSPNIWGWIADRSGRSMAIVRLGSGAAAICFSAVFYAHSFWWLAWVMVTYSFFWNATLPQFEATTFKYLGSNTHRYSSIRLWGSIGFIVTVIGLGYVLDPGKATRLLPVVMVLFVSIWLFSLWVPEHSPPSFSVTPAPLRQVLAKPGVIALLAVCFLMQLSHGPYYTFYSIYLEQHHYSRGTIGQLWALGVLAEILLFLLMHRLVVRFGLRRLLLLSLLLAALRWALIANFVELLPVLVFAQLLHAASFGLYHASAIQLIHRSFTGHHQGRGQALYSSLSFGAGGALGSYGSGLIWDDLGAGVIYGSAMGVCLLGFLVAWRWVSDAAH